MGSIRTTKKKGFKITIYGCADYHEGVDDDDALNFANTVNKLMKDYLHYLQEGLDGKSFVSKSYFNNCEIMGHSNKDYPDQSI